MGKGWMITTYRTAGRNDKVLSTEPSTKEGKLTEVPLAEAEIKKTKSNKKQKQEDGPSGESLTVPKGTETARPWPSLEPG